MAAGIFPKVADMSISEGKERLPAISGLLRDRHGDLLQRDTTAIHYSEVTFKAIRDILFEREGFDLDSYKDKCIQRRISFRLRTSGCKNTEEYIELLNKKEEEVKKLLNALTINVTEFFRNQSTFDKLKDIVFPDIFAAKGGSGTVRIWSAGCASGEEPYTIAIILKEFFSEELKRFNIEITATDVDEGILKKAAEGHYKRDKLVGMVPGLMVRYFKEDGDKYRLSNDIKKMVSFRKEDIFQERLHREKDLIICRNLLIYFSRVKQEWVLNEFWKALNPGGFLILGRAEILVGESRKLFSSICPRERIYRK
ncbi:MAG: chemotaxis protein CheR [Deltaproteobacteria bacterium]|nr:chemotaxis protein CheR [Deltaproteobacteria bacterium]MBM2837876.1 chemotaxis protein CheR [Deltaproteobacteria bacterium]